MAAFIGFLLLVGAAYGFVLLVRDWLRFLDKYLWKKGD